MFCGLVSNKENRIIMQSRNKLETQQPSRAEASMFLWWKHVSKKVKKWEWGDSVWAKNEKIVQLFHWRRKINVYFYLFPCEGKKVQLPFKIALFFTEWIYFDRIMNEASFLSITTWRLLAFWHVKKCYFWKEGSRGWDSTSDEEGGLCQYTQCAEYNGKIVHLKRRYVVA